MSLISFKKSQYERRATIFSALHENIRAVNTRFDKFAATLDVIAQGTP